MPNYYAVSSETGQIVESADLYPSEVQGWAQDLADELGEEIWVIEGQHTGITVTPEPDIQDEDELTEGERHFLNKVDLEIQKATDQDALRRWNEGVGIPGYLPYGNRSRV